MLPAAWHTQYHSPKKISQMNPRSLSPWQMLPFEIFGEIFVWCLSQNPHTVRQPDTSIAPMLLCQICSSWRSTAFATPKLWTHICFRLTLSSIHSEKEDGSTEQSGARLIHPQSLNFIKWWMCHAHPLPLSLYLECPSEIRTMCYLDEDENYLRHTIPYLGGEPEIQFYSSEGFRSVRDLALSLPENDLRTIFAIESLTFRNLECLNLNIYADLRPRLIDQQYVLPTSPRLRRLRLSNYQHIPSIPWVQLTHLCIFNEIEQRNWFDVLRGCRNLKFGAFTIKPSPQDVQGTPAPSAVEDPSQTRISAPNLRQLAVTRSGLHGILLPGLRALRIVNFNLPRFPDFAALAHLLTAAPNLVELHLDLALINFLCLYDGSANIVPLNILLPDLEILVLDYKDNNCRGKHIVRLLQSGWICLKSKAHRGRVDIIVHAPSALDTFLSFGTLASAKNDFVQEITAYLEMHRHFFTYDVVVHHSDRLSLLFEWSKDLRSWDEAIGFYDDEAD